MSRFPTDLWQWPALAGAAALMGEELRCELGLWGKVHGQASDYRWIARSPGFGAGVPDSQRHLRLGAEDQPARAAAWRAPWVGGDTGEGGDYFAIGTYPSRALDAAGRGAVLEKRVLHWRRPAPGFPVALAAAALLPLAAQADDRLWWDRVGEGDWQDPDDALPLAPADCPGVTLGPAALETVIAAGLEALLATLEEPQLAALYAGLLAGLRPVHLGGLAQPLPPGALAAVLLPLTPAQAQRCSLCAWVPATLIDPRDLGRDWDLVVTRQSAPHPDPALAPEFRERGARLAAALYARDPGLIPDARTRSPGAAPLLVPVPAPHLAEVGDGTPAVHPYPRLIPDAAPSPALPSAAAGDRTTPVHPNPRMHLAPGAASGRPGLAYLHEFADAINLRRLDLTRLAADLAAPGAWPVLAPGEDPADHPLVHWIRRLEAHRPAAVDPADWAFKLDQLRAAALLLLPHPTTLDLVGLPRDPRVPALLAVLAADPATVGEHLAAHRQPTLHRLLAHSRACPDTALVADLETWVARTTIANPAPV